MGKQPSVVVEKSGIAIINLPILKIFVALKMQKQEENGLIDLRRLGINFLSHLEFNSANSDRKIRK